MKRLTTIFMLGAFVVVLAACSGADSESDSYSNGAIQDEDSLIDADGNEIFVIDERFFVMRVWDVIFSPNEFIGRTIQYEGMFNTFDTSDEGHFYKVYRYTDGCCGPDSMIGFEVRLDNIDIEPFADDTWVKVTGVVEEFEVRGHTLLRVNVTSIVEMDERGAEYVTSR